MATNSEKITHNACEDCDAVCCKYQPSALVPPDNLTQLEYWKARACKSIETKGGTIFLSEMRCPHLMENNECDIYDERPEICKKFPYKNDKHAWLVLCKLKQEQVKERDSILKIL